MAGLDIGITIGRASDDLSTLLWSSGIGQNAVFLALAMLRQPEVGRVFLIDCSEAATRHPLSAWTGIPAITPAWAAEHLHLVVECGARASAETMARLRDRGGKLVSYMAGNAMALNFEAMSSDLPHGETMSAVPFDAVWITPQHWHMNRAHAALTRSPNVAITPHLWEPLFLQAYMRDSGINPLFKALARATGAWRIGILEPNVNVLKTFHLPLLVAEEAYRAAPGLIDRVLVFNSLHLVGVPHFDDITTTLDLHRDGRVFAEARFPTPLVLAEHVDAVVVHQWENDLNYLYWDVLWCGHPLIHNSPALEGVGYRYGAFDPQDGGRVLADALSRHAAEAPAARAAALDFLRQFSIDAPDVIARHSVLIGELFG